MNDGTDYLRGLWEMVERYGWNEAVKRFRATRRAEAGPMPMGSATKPAASDTARGGKT